MIPSPSYYLYSIEFSLFSVHSEASVLFYHHLALGVFLIVVGMVFKNYM